ncbi:MAG: glycosyltransferase, partial [Hyphomicrobiaceae bacterium]
IKMPGPSHSVSDWYTAAHVFCLSSLWEGFPNAVAEAMAHGLPCVGFAGCAGVRDLITHEQNGLLAEGNGGAQSLAKALETLMGSAEMRSSLGERAVHSIKPYSPDDIFDLWEQTLTRATKY